MSSISTHILDISLGKPAGGVAVVLEVKQGGSWHEEGSGTTDEQGRIREFLPGASKLRTGTCRLRFATGAYFKAQSRQTLYPEVQIVFQLADPAAHYHLPLLLSPYGYSTYRGT